MKTNSRKKMLNCFIPVKETELVVQSPLHIHEFHICGFNRGLKTLCILKLQLGIHGCGGSTVCIVPSFYIKRFNYPWGSLNQSPVDTEGSLYLNFCKVKNYTWVFNCTGLEWRLALLTSILFYGQLYNIFPQESSRFIWLQY